jgi:hypothetical protein
MAIPNGTKFHGVAPSVDTKNRGSEQANAMRDVYTYPDDFNAGGGSNIVSYQGTIRNLGANLPPFVDILGGSSAAWTFIGFSADQFGGILAPFDCKVVGVIMQWASSVDYQFARGSADISFKISTASLGTDMVDAASWSTVSPGISEIWDGTSGTYPGFVEDGDLSGTITKGTSIQITAINTDTFADGSEEVEVSIILQKI